MTPLAERWRVAPYTASMYGYEAPKPVRPGGCRDALIILRAVFEVMLPIVATGLAAVAVVAATVILFTIHALLTLIPVGIGTLALVWLARRDRAEQDAQRRHIERPH